MKYSKKIGILLLTIGGFIYLFLNNYSNKHLIDNYHSRNYYLKNYSDFELLDSIKQHYNIDVVISIYPEKSLNLLSKKIIIAFLGYHTSYLIHVRRSITGNIEIKDIQDTQIYTNKNSNLDEVLTQNAISEIEREILKILSSINQIDNKNETIILKNKDKTLLFYKSD